MEKDPSLNGSSEIKLLAPVPNWRPFQEVNGELVPVTVHALSEAQKLSRAGRVVIVDEEAGYTLALPESYKMPENLELGDLVIKLTPHDNSLHNDRFNFKV